MAVAEVVGNIREQLRQWSRDKELEVGDMRGRLLGLCDTIRDELLPPLGIRLEDREAGESGVCVCVCVYLTLPYVFVYLFHKCYDEPMLFHETIPFHWELMRLKVWIVCLCVWYPVRANSYGITGLVYR